MKSKKVMILIAALVVTLSCNVPRKTYYSCPNPVDKQGKLKQKLPKPPVQFNSKRFKQ